MTQLKPNLMVEANIFSYLTFWWMNGFFKHGFKTDLQESDMFELQKSDTSAETSARLEKNWRKELNLTNTSKKPSLFRAIAKTYGKTYMWMGIVVLLEEGFRTASPVLIAGLVRYFENINTAPTWHAYAYASAVSISTFFIAFFGHMYYYHAQTMGWHIRTSTCAMMYKKLPEHLHSLWLAPLQCIVVAVILWQEVGVAVLAGMSVLVLSILIQMMMGVAFGKLRILTAVLTDERVRLMNEVIAGMRIIKMYTWEKPFARLVTTARKKEIRKILQSSVLRGLIFTMYLCQEKFMVLATLATYIAMGGQISASQVFLLVGLAIALRTRVGYCFATSIATLAESLKSMERIQTFLLLDEVKTKPSDLDHEKTPESLVELKNFSAKWNEKEEESKFCLRDISVRVSAGQFLAVIGPVGSGKSSFLNAILGELEPSSGEVNVRGQLSFANQVPWVFSGTVRENILFGDLYDSARYEKVIYACSLEKDLEQLPNGDLTLVGERGVTLSGGQKARVNLARAVYRKDASICLMDDPLSAVDAVVGNHIYKECISGLMKEKTRILVTHQLQLLKDADHIMILKEGRVDNQGTYEELQADGTDFAALLQKNEEQVDQEENGCFAEEIPEFKRSSNRKRLSSRLRSKRGFKPSLSSTKSVEYKPMEELEELREQGSIEGKVYVEYFGIGGKTIFPLILLVVIFTSGVIIVMGDWWLAQWAFRFEQFTKATSKNVTTISISTVANASTTPSSSMSLKLSTHQDVEFDTRYYILIYSALALSLCVSVLLVGLVHYSICLASAINMHHKMLRAIFRSPIRFFDTNPVGRILNRFSKDMGQIDELLPSTLMNFLCIFANIIIVTILTSIINYFVIIILLPLLVYFIWLRRYYLRTSRDIKRLEGTTRSPVFSLLSTTLQGLLTVRAYNSQQRFVDKFHENQDLHSSSWYLFICGSRWFGLRLDVVTTIFNTALAMLSVIAASVLHLEAGIVGMILTYSVSLVGLFQFGVRESAEVENLMTSVERVQQYYRLPSEAADEVPEKQPHSDWPTNGSIKFENVSFAYYEDGPTVLSNLTFEIKPKEKIGLVGRTGAGKSSLISALFRLSELREGEIFIDGIPISPLGLSDLRIALSIIPQDPILFTETMKRNLDPFSKYEEEQLWNVLEQVELKEVVDKLPHKLDTKLAESGSNFSVGQRQLVCLARAILRKSKILVIDEATANVDVRTDQLIQRTIRDKFKHCTVITIAHRINTIIDSDKVMFLDEGHLKEFDEPHKLLQLPNGFFNNMVKNTGNKEAETLRTIAKETFLHKHGDVMDDVESKEKKKSK